MATKTVFILGAGFTKAFCPDAPLMVDEKWNDAIKEFEKQYSKHAYVQQIIKQSKHKGKVDIERLLTRLDSTTPYDAVDKSKIHDLISAFEMLRRIVVDTIGTSTIPGFIANRQLSPITLSRITDVYSPQPQTETIKEKEILHIFCKYLLATNSNCITFNYDTVLEYRLTSIRWEIRDGYGFISHGTGALTGAMPVGVVSSQRGPFLLKLHGSINWGVKAGLEGPFSFGDIFYCNPDHQLPSILVPLLFPPTFNKSQIAEQPIMKAVWSYAYSFLSQAEKLVFIGYSFPETDITSRFLFSEATTHITDHKNIRVVNFAETDEQKASFKETYRNVFSGIPDENFYFDGAVDWIKNNIDSTTT